MRSNTLSSSQGHALQCLEVWGGNQAIETTLTVPGIDAWVFASPFEGNAYAGDVHYVSMCGAGRVSRFAVADVSGHDARAGDLAGSLRKLMRKHIHTPDQTQFAQSLSDEFLRLAEGGQFATALLATYFAPTDQLIICNAGHPRPLWYHHAAGTWTFMENLTPQLANESRNLPLGIIEGTRYSQFAVELGERDRVVLYTDALSEARGSANAMLDEEGLLECARRLPVRSPSDLGRALLESVAAYRGGRPANDDQTIVVLHHNASNPPRQTLGEKLRVMARMLGLGLGGN